ncbi:hypothetical protein W97_08903 [Coniosporium apollinis CBS 100218]|uniref:Methyltransferase domain-containing protein n=1 Tax=Coniosporium apollinis (strain CBS 100218) TaxID=1168221 RepID=R7Z6C4_CONA1|nr:uncharacterized protein W97_08903 [Coniosporium apollinis CBS 100218]EON69643.1 hypothetical protein W97_08903 [Coniosporium apollinis CBS 100218]
MQSEGGPPAQVQAEDNVTEANDGNHDDGDSAFAPSEGDESSTASITSSILEYRTKNGRVYHREGKYFLPNDERELDRLDLQHHMFLLTFDNKLCLCPIPQDKQLHRVLDVGTGTGIWAMDFADDHPESKVTGVDLSPTQPSFVPPNVFFEVDDLEKPWTFNQKFNFIHCRMMTVSFSDWPGFFERAFEFLEPGGYIEVTDTSLPARADDDSLHTNSALQKWCEMFLEASRNIGRPANSAESYKSQMEAAGFQNVVERKFRWPLDPWPEDQKLKMLGRCTFANVYQDLTGISVELFTNGLELSTEEVEVLLVDVRKEMKDTKIHAYFPVHVFYAQKPS